MDMLNNTVPAAIIAIPTLLSNIPAIFGLDPYCPSMAFSIYTDPKLTPRPTINNIKPFST